MIHLQTAYTNPHLCLVNEQGPISSICTWGDLLVSCGSTARPLNPYDQSPNAPTRLFPDALIRVSTSELLVVSIPTPPASASLTH